MNYKQIREWEETHRLTPIPAPDDWYDGHASSWDPELTTQTEPLANNPLDTYDEPIYPEIGF